MSYRRILLAALGGALAATIWMWRPAQAPNWSPAEVSQIETLWIENLPPVPIDPTNAVADDPNAAEFGHALFFDTRLSATARRRSSRPTTLAIPTRTGRASCCVPTSTCSVSSWT